MTDDDLETHIHGIGVTRSGKSKWLEALCRYLLVHRIQFCLIDPQGTLYAALLEWITFMRLRSAVVLHPGAPGVGYTAFVENSRDRSYLSTKVARMVAATMRIWGEDPRSTPRLKRYLTCFYYIMLEQGFPISRLRGLLDYKAEAGRAGVLQRIKSEDVRSDLVELYRMPLREYTAQIESTKNRLDALRHPELLKLFTKPGITIPRLRESKTSLLVNLQSSGIVAEEQMQIVGTLLVNDIWQYFDTITERKPAPFFLIIDECQRYITPDISLMLDGAAKRGLHLVLFHQREGQLTPQLASALTNARTKITFSTDAEPREKRHYEIRRNNMEREEHIAPEVRRYPVAPSRIESHVQALLKPWESPIIEDVEPELSDDDYYR